MQENSARIIREIRKHLQLDTSASLHQHCVFVFIRSYWYFHNFDFSVLIHSNIVGSEIKSMRMALDRVHSGAFWKSKTGTGTLNLVLALLAALNEVPTLNVNNV